MKPSWAASVLVATILAGAATEAVAGEPRATVELFTSQGCSSCPPADKVLGELVRDPSLVAVSMPIDYWDYLGWKDTLALPRHTVRQRGYAAVRGDREVYTPQVVVNGLVHVVGSDRNAIEDAIARTKGREGALSVPVNLSLDEQGVTVSIAPAKEAATVAEVWLCTVTKAIPVAIKRGENRNRTLTYNNIARRWIRVGTWTGSRQRWTVPESELKAEGVDSLIVFVQAGGMEKPGVVLGAHVISLR